MSGPVHVPVSSVMSAPVRTISPLASVREAIERLHEHQIPSLVVDRRDENDECGILSLTDIAARVINENRAPGRVHVYEIMAKPVVMVPERMDIRIAIRLLVRFDLSRVVVHDRDRNPVGMVSLRDVVLRHLRHEEEEEEG